jgi:hypothetical protein
MAFQEWVVTVKITEEAADSLRHRFYSDKHMIHRLKLEIEAHIPGVKVDAAVIVSRKEFV